MLRINRRTLLTGAAGLAIGGAGVSVVAGPAAAEPNRRGDRIASVAYIEVNDNSLLNVGQYTLEDGSPGRIRTSECLSQSQVPYRLATGL